jgi:hypothetical protein
MARVPFPAARAMPMLSDLPSAPASDHRTGRVRGCAVRRWRTAQVALGLAAALSFATPAASTERVSVVDISQASRSEVDLLKQLPHGAWWLEIGDRLIVVGDAAAARIAQSKARVLATRANVDTERLLLRAEGCSEHSSERGIVVAEGGRWELRLVAEREVETLLGEHAWRLVPRNTTLSRQYRLDAPARAKGADPAVQAVVDRIDAARWFGDVGTLAGWDRSSYGASSLVSARDWIRAQFDQIGLVSSLQPFSMSSPGGTITRDNVIGTWVGASQPERVVVVGAHYDSRNQNSSSTSGTPGAEDNASGCAGVIELARALIPSNPAPSILFICYAGEEQGLRGSAAHVQALSQSGALARVDLAVIMDMIGYSADANLQALFESNDDQVEYLGQFAAAAATYAPELDVVLSTHPFGSDHVPYLNAGVRTALAIENDWNSYPHYHRSTDTPANLGPHAQGMGGAILRTNAALIAELGGLAVVVEPLLRDGFEAQP